jgi:acyl carrier protein
MTNLEKLECAFTETFGIEKEQLNGLKYQAIIEWDSIGHLGLVAAIEDAFSITMDMDDIIDLSSFEKCKEIVKKYGVEL